MTNDLELRWARAAAWADGRSRGPFGQGLDENECRDIEELRDLILELDEGPHQELSA